MKEFLVTTVIPLYNGGKLIKKAIESVVAQTIFDKTELILIDDGSSDDSYSIAQFYKKKFPNNIVLIKNEKNLGIAKTHNKALKSARGTYVARLDQDDRWIDKSKLEKQAKLLDDNPEIGLVGTWSKVINKSGPDFELIPPVDDESIRAKFLLACMFVTPSVMFRKSITKKIGFYRDDLKYGTEDYEFWLRIGIVSKLANIPDYCLEYNFHPGSYSNKNKIMAIKEHVEIIKSYRKYYPNYQRAFIKNYIQYNLLKITFLRKLYDFIVPRIAGKIYS